MEDGGKKNIKRNKNKNKIYKATMPASPLPFDIAQVDCQVLSPATPSLGGIAKAFLRVLIAGAVEREFSVSLGLSVFRL